MGGAESGAESGRGTFDLGLTGRRVLVTGGTRGIGRAVSTSFARAGARVTACYRNGREAADTLAVELAAFGTGHHVVRANVTDPDQVTTLVGDWPDRWDVVINNVGVDGRAPLAALPTAEWSRVLDTNLTAAFLVARAALPALAPGGSLVLVGGAVAGRGAPGMAHHNASKAGVTGLVRSLAKEWGARGLRINAVAPGVIETDPDGGPPPPVKAELAGLTALGRLGRPDDVAGVVLFLASARAGYLTGVSITADGGI